MVLETKSFKYLLLIFLCKKIDPHCDPPLPPKLISLSTLNERHLRMLQHNFIPSLQRGSLGKDFQDLLYILISKKAIPHCGPNLPPRVKISQLLINTACECFRISFIFSGLIVREKILKKNYQTFSIICIISLSSRMWSIVVSTLNPLSLTVFCANFS